MQHAEAIIGKHEIDLESDPPPDIVVEVDVATESIAKFPIYAALGVAEIWRYDGNTVEFYARDGDAYQPVAESASFPGLTPSTLASALAQSKTDGQSAALRSFRTQLPN